MATMFTPQFTPALLNAASENDDTSSSGTNSAPNGNTATMQEPLTIDAFLRLRAVQMGKSPWVSYPSSGIKYVDYSPQQLDTFATRLAQHYALLIPPRPFSTAPEVVVGILGPSNLEYLITLIALTKLGHTVLFLSTRLSAVAYLSLLKTTGAMHLLVDDVFQKMATSILVSFPELVVDKIASRETFEEQAASSMSTLSIAKNLDPKIENTKIAWIIHSSGSTGLPKPIYQTHRAALENYANNMNMVGFITLPLFHAHGLSCLFRALNVRKKIMLYNASLPLTQEYLLGVLRGHGEIEIFYGVPYALKILGETPNGIAALAKLKTVMSGGSACPDTLGDRLVARGVNLVSHFGTTETGQLMNSSRPAGDKDWNYLRAMPAVLPYLRWEPKGDGIYELVVLDGLKSKVVSNRPDGAYATKDLFTPHPTTKNAWKYYARLDDTITLVNGEKAVPNLFEHEIRTNANVSEAIIFGAGKPSLGMMIIPSPVTEGFDNEVILGSILPSLEMANKVAPAYAQISMDMIKFLPADTTLPKTDKGTVIRARFYKEFEAEIDAVYEATEIVSGQLTLSEEELQEWLHKALAATLNVEEDDIDDDADFFSFGVDSLRAIQLRSLIVKHINTGGHKLGSNIAFDYPTIKALAQYLYRLRAGDNREAISIEKQMAMLIDKYSSFEQHQSQKNPHSGQYVVVTGATGSLGAHVVGQLATRDDTEKVYCLVRASSTATADQRVLDSLRERCVYDDLPSQARNKIEALPSNFALPDLGLGEEAYSRLASKITSLIHCAWSVNFNLALTSFEKDCIAGTHNLINLCLVAKRPKPAHFNFCSSVSTVAATPSRHAPEALPAELSYALGMGYAQGKLVTEHMCMRAAKQTGIKARVLRVGQVIGDTKAGVWNATEAIPMILQCALTVGALPKLDEEPLWLPVDVVAKATIEISLSDAVSTVVNVVNHRGFHWTRDLLLMVRRALPGVEYKEVTQREWIRNLRKTEQDPSKNPPIKLLKFFEGKYDSDEAKIGMRYETDKARKYSQALADAPVINEAMVGKFVEHWQATAWKTRDQASYKNVIAEYLEGDA
jgi:thioester reductase-like protein